MEIPRYWRTKKQRYSLVGEICPTCHAHLFPPRPVCPYCRDEGAHQPFEMHRETALVLPSRIQLVDR